MALSITKALLVVNFLLCQEVNSSISSFQKYQNDTDNDLKIFINNLKIAYLEKSVPRHITILGASAQDLPEIQPLFESYPYIICTKPETCVFHSSFSRGSFLIIFLQDLREETFERSLDILSICRECKVLYIFRGIILQTDRVSHLFTKTVHKYGVNARLAYLEGNVTKFYGYSMAENCSVNGRLSFVWKPGLSPISIDTWASGLNDLNGCRITVSSLTFAPKMLIKERENGSLTIAGGMEGELLLALAKKFNFTIKLKYPSAENQNRYSRKSSILLDVTSGRARIGIGRLRPVLEDEIAFSVAYDHDCVTWGVPRVVIQTENFVWMEFTWSVWVLVGLVFAISCVFGWATHGIDGSKSGNRKNMGIVGTVMEVLAIHVGSPIVNVPRFVSGKFLLILCLLYATVLTTAYKTSLASILTTDNGSPGIIDMKGIVEANLSVGGASYHLEFLEDQVDGNETISKLIKRFEVINEPSEVMRRLKFDDKFAGISRGSAMLYERHKLTVDRKPMTFNILRDCVLRHQTAMVFHRTSALRENADCMIRRLKESGIPSYWDYPKNDIERKPSTDDYLESSTRQKFKDIFILYVCCTVLCLIAFFIEICTSITYNRKKMVFTSS